MKIKTDYVSAEVDYLTAGKEYEANQSEEYSWCYTITTDSGEEELVCLSSCAHLDGRSWTIVKDEPHFTQEQARDMYELLERLSPIMQDNRYFGVSDEIDTLLAKARGEL